MKKLIPLCVFLIYLTSLDAQWQVVDSIVTGSLQSIHFLNPDTGFVYSEYAALRKTEDGTKSWDTAQIIFDSYILDMDFADANIGYAVGGAWFPFGRFYANSIMKTLDGGNTWDSVYGNHQNGVFNDVEVISANEFYALGEVWACHSTDGGVTLDTMMVSQSVNERFLKVSFLSPQHGYLLTQIYVQSQVAAYQLYETVDGGNTWMMMYSDTLSYPGFSDFLFNGSGDGMLVGEKGQIRISKGSNSWTAVPLQDTAVWLHEVAMADGKVYAIGSKGMPAAINKLYSSVDFGVNWQEEQLNLDPADYITDMSFPKGGVGYLSTYRKVYRNSSLLSVEKHIPTSVGIFPNPADDFVRLDLPKNSEVNVQLVNSMGQEVARWKSIDNYTRLDISVIPSGVYFLLIQSDESTYSSSSMIISH